MRRNSLPTLGLLAACSIPGFASLIPIGSLPDAGNGLGAVLSLVTFQNTGTEVGCVGVSSGGVIETGSAQCFGGVVAPGGATDETTGSGNNIYTAGTLNLAAAGANTFANVVLVFNGNEGGNVGEQGITLTNLSLNLFSTTGVLLGAFSTPSPYTASAFPGVGNAGFAFQLDAAQAAAANAILAANPDLIVGGSAAASNAQGGPETVFISRIDSVQPGPGPDPLSTPEPAGLWMMGGGLLSVALFLKRVNPNATN